MNEKNRQIITLMTDFGEKDFYAGAVKGAIYSVNRNVNIVDVSHSIGTHNIREAAFTLYGYYNSFPTRTIHLVVVDPGVGTSRSALLVTTSDYRFIAPDNGVLSYIYDKEEIEKVVEIDAPHYYADEISNTFHARDIFAPCAAWLAKDIDTLNFGETTEDYETFDIPEAKTLGNKLIKGEVIHFDRFGNIITNIGKEDFQKLRDKHPDTDPKLLIAGKEITDYREDYSPEKKTLFFIIGGSGFIEIAGPGIPAKNHLQVKRGKEVGISFE